MPFVSIITKVAWIHTECMRCARPHQCRLPAFFSPCENQPPNVEDCEHGIEESKNLAVRVLVHTDFSGLVEGSSYGMQYPYPTVSVLLGVFDRHLAVTVVVAYHSSCSSRHSETCCTHQKCGKVLFCSYSLNVLYGISAWLKPFVDCAYGATHLLDSCLAASHRTWSQ